MELCRGFKDWFECLKCPHLCTKKCPLEGENVMEEMQKLLSNHRIAENKKGRDVWKR
jgi:hypothetical protein